MKQGNNFLLKAALFSIIFVLLPVLAVGAAGTPVDAGAAEKPMEISWIARLIGEIDDDNWCQNRIEEKFNVKLINVAIPMTEGERLELLVTSGEFPDAAQFWVPSKYKLFEDGVTRSIPKAMIEKYAPLYTKLLIEKGTRGWFKNRVPGTEDEYFAMTCWQKMSGGLRELQFRLDWLENIGEAPADAFDMYPDDEKYSGCYYLSPSHPTIDWIEKVLFAFRDDDPDGNGKNDTIPLGFNNHPTVPDEALMGMYGLRVGMNMMENGELTMPEVSNAYKEYLTKINSWFEAGLIDSEFMILDYKAALVKWAEGNVGVWGWHAGYMKPTQATWTPLFDNHPGSKLMVTAPPKGPEGKFGTNGDIDTFDGGGYMFGKQVDDEKLAKILQIYDWVNFDPKEFVHQRYGEPGVHFDWFGEPWNSGAKLREGYPAYGGALGLRFYTSYCHGTAEKALYSSQPGPNHIGTFFQTSPNDTKFVITPYRFDPLGETKVNEINSKYGSALNTIVQEFRFKAITGDLDINKEWDAYVKKWLDSGGAGLIEVMKEGLLYSEWMAGRMTH